MDPRKRAARPPARVRGSTSERPAGPVWGRGGAIASRRAGPGRATRHPHRPRPRRPPQADAGGQTWLSYCVLAPLERVGALIGKVRGRAVQRRAPRGARARARRGPAAGVGATASAPSPRRAPDPAPALQAGAHITALERASGARIKVDPRAPGADARVVRIASAAGCA
jgi:hypothetical protein